MSELSSKLRFVAMLLFILLPSTYDSKKRPCYDGCDVVSQVLTCSKLKVSDLPHLDSCKAVIVDLRNQDLECTCDFVDFTERISGTVGVILFHNVDCSSEDIKLCSMAHSSDDDRKFPPTSVYTIVTSHVFDLSIKDFRVQLERLARRQKRIISSLRKHSVRKRYKNALRNAKKKAYKERASAIGQSIDFDEPEDTDVDDDDEIADEIWDVVGPSHGNHRRHRKRPKVETQKRTAEAPKATGAEAEKSVGSDVSKSFETDENYESLETVLIICLFFLGLVSLGILVLLLQKIIVWSKGTTTREFEKNNSNIESFRRTQKKSINIDRLLR